ncbi:MULTISPECIES: ABC transporter substrate-binding protein [unclassified Actinomyces]|uniref:ABC transporter substrate-binding protein n=1 Tax=unclassified Actinomyces TaxID=2609248 RepID=UPI0020172E4F|nr:MULTISPECIES: ABC transporter substrate-binding protein [unclassified Actinomyces]MCL3777422.1 ABC transporter substrate-binding protein [Actinomyces sp. AC-20-1]MCL3790516.1 ABC transporter substrate-binding protein [Actinomyces sp. 187325]MCL3792096.1 ABC transporter substrate-binding protein [Actinomyces sp. 186855]MCL3795205.1 ABC transporter substrate-binding protein [Actinomyces sp. 217892]
MHPVSRRVFLGGTSLLAVAATLSACTSAGTGGSGSTTKDTLTLGMTADIEGWDPTNQPGYQGWPGEAIWGALVYVNEVGEMEPGLAESWEVGDGNHSFTAHLRRGVTFSDGDVADADAVKANFELAAANEATSSMYQGITFDIPDAHTITITWPEPQPLMADRVGRVKLTSPTLIASGNLNDKPVGFGPYLLDEAGTTRSSVYTFTKNPDHWDADRYPYTTLVCKVFDSETAALNALKTGQIDGTLVNAQSHDEVTGSGFEVAEMNGQTTRLLLTDHKGEIIPALGDVRVRRAINMVFDKQAMVDALYSGHGEVSHQIFRPGSAAYIDDLADPYPFDVETAKALMAEAGYADGFAIELPTMDGQNHDVLMPYVTQQLAELNITVTQVPLTGANAIGDLLSGTYPVVLWQLGNIGNSAQDIDIVVRHTGYWNLEHQPDDFVNDRWDVICTGTEEESAAAQKEINQYIIEQAWFAPMVNPTAFYAHTADVTITHVSDLEGLAPKLRDFQ